MTIEQRELERLGQQEAAKVRMAKDVREALERFEQAVKAAADLGLMLELEVNSLFAGQRVVVQLHRPFKTIRLIVRDVREL